VRRAAPAGRPIGLWLEIKSPERYPGVEEALAEVLRTTPGRWLTSPRRADFFKATSLNFESLRRFAEVIDHAVPAGGIASTVPDDATLPELATWMEYYIVNYRPRSSATAATASRCTGRTTGSSTSSATTSLRDTQRGARRATGAPAPGSRSARCRRAGRAQSSGRR
jgi:hypothetical protein